VTNLAINGIQAMPAGGHLRIAVGRGARQVPDSVPDHAEGWLWLEVSDEGPGIAPEHLPHIFEPFYTTKAIGEGTGLGLAVVQAIVHEQGGWVEVANQPGAGARFTVFLAAAKTEPVLERLAS
jgi:signal transduction histidine kinase